MLQLRRLGSVWILVSLAITGYPAAQQTPPKPVAPRRVGYAQVGAVRMYYQVYGRGRPLLMLHGGGVTIEESFAGQLGDFAGSHLIVAPEQMGHGRTRDVEGALDYVQMAEQTSELLRQLHITDADVLGWSDGGILGLLLAIRHPELVRRLAIASASILPVKEAATPEALAELESWKPEEDYAVFASKLKEMWLRQPTAEELGTAELAKIAAPTLVIAGDHDAIRLAHTLQIYQAIPKAQLLIVPGTGHDTLVKRAAWLNPILRTFFDAPEP